jgi:hypothetical protein
MAERNAKTFQNKIVSSRDKQTENSSEITTTFFDVLKSSGCLVKIECLVFE